MERCLCCNARLGEAVTCPRCQADLGLVISSEKAAQFWLSKAIEYWLDNEAGKSIAALGLSIQLKKTKLAVVLRGFLIQQFSQDILELLIQKQVTQAKQQFYRIRYLLPHSDQLQQLQKFTEYLWIKDQ